MHTKEERIRNALWGLFIGDALAMPAHWYYNLENIKRDFNGGVVDYEDALHPHPESFMVGVDYFPNIHNQRPFNITGRYSRFYNTNYSEMKIALESQEHEHGNATPKLEERYHYHHGLKAGENTLGAQLVRVLMRSVSENGSYSDAHFINDFIAYLTSDSSNDPYTEIYIRRFFEHYTNGASPMNAAELQSNTWSIGSHGGLIRPLVLSLLYDDPVEALGIAIEHQNLTHRSQNVASSLSVLLPLLHRLTDTQKPLDAFVNAGSKLHLPTIQGEALFELYRKYNGPGNIPKEMMFRLHTTFQKEPFDLKAFMQEHQESEVVRTLLANACYTEHGVPLLLYLCVQHNFDLKDALLANVNAGGDNVHRGMIMGLLLGACSERVDDNLKKGLVDYEELNQEIEAFVQIQSLV
ncbi:MAG: ADP-ribosylglycohydrolase family protein [Sulfurimonadaceae bacterium]